MNIVILGAGAIGSLFGGFLSKNNTVVLIGRTPHIQAIQKSGLSIIGKTRMRARVSAETSLENIHMHPDLVILTVKSYDTREAMQKAASVITSKTLVVSLQNGLDNIEKIEKIVDSRQVLGGVTTHGAILVKPGVIHHTGVGQTILGELTGKSTDRLVHLVSLFNDAGIETTYTSDLLRELWIKAIINSSINPLTSLFSCKNGYLLENPLLEKMIEHICTESTSVAVSQGIQVLQKDMVEKTKKVIEATAENHSSMLQSIQKGKKTEIDSINGVICKYGKTQGVDVSLNEILVFLLHACPSNGRKNQ